MKISKRYSSLKSSLDYYKPLLNFLSRGHPKVVFGIFEILSFSFLTNFLIYTIVFYWKPNIWNNWKTSDHRAKRSEIFLTRGWMFSVYRDLLTVKWLRSFLGHSVNFQFSASFWKRLVVEQNGVKFGPRDEYLAYTGFFWQFSGWVHSGVIQCISNFR